jgi:hypothetical protein
MRLLSFNQRMCFIYQIYTTQDKKLRYGIGNWGTAGTFCHRNVTTTVGCNLTKS